MGISSNLVGARFGRLLVIARGPGVGTRGESRWVCRCDCGREKETGRKSLVKGNSQSCGCLMIERSRQANTRHGARYTRAHHSWSGILDRCTNPTSKDRERYSARGITVCERWRDFKNFLADMGQPPPGHSIDRINNDGNYEPDNCRWATAKQQANNRRKRKTMRAIARENRAAASVTPGDLAGAGEDEQQ